MDRILELRHDAVTHGYTNTNGARHAEAFTDLVKHSGWLDENRLPVMSAGMFNIKELVQLMPVGLRMLVHRKMPPLIHKPIPGVERVRRLFARFEGA
jgi:succinate dehydrogenase / fumarate reductase iron-sulfur subunit